MTTGVVLLAFGEPDTPDRDAVEAYLERIFRANADLEAAEDPAARARQLAERRAPGLVAEYEAIGGSPLNAQAIGQADALQATLREAGYEARTYVGMQYTDPLIDEAVAAAHADGVDRLVGLPLYPLCGPSTTIIALETLQDAVADRDWDAPVREITGWHRHPAYTRLRAETVAETADDRGLDLTAPDTTLLFSAHGTPTHYLEEGSRYDVYVDEYCAVQAALLGVEEYEVGYQNHENRDIPWTEPDVDDLVPRLAGRHLVVEPISFLHEQSETLAELDRDLQETAEAAGLDFHRVPIPHDDDRLSAVFADLLEPFLADFDPGYYRLHQCQCRDRAGTVCLNAAVE